MWPFEAPHGNLKSYMSQTKIWLFTGPCHGPLKESPEEEEAESQVALCETDDEGRHLPYSLRSRQTGHLQPSFCAASFQENACLPCTTLVSATSQRRQQM